MIKLEQVSIEKLMQSIKYSWAGKGENIDVGRLERYECFKLLREYNVTNFQELKELIESGKRDFQKEFFKDVLYEAQYLLLLANYHDSDLEIYPADDYKGYTIDREFLDYTDNNTNGNVLLIGNPLIKNSVQKGAIAPYSIYSLKQMLNTVIVGKNYCKNALIGSVKHMGKKGAIEVRDAINLYEAQVRRLYNEYKWCRKENLENVNLFTLDQAAKLKLVEEQIDEILLYLLDNGNEFMWGSLSVAQKELLRNALKGSNNRHVEIARECMIKIISNYTTLGELEEGLVRTRVINRFIK